MWNSKYYLKIVILICQKPEVPIREGFGLHQPSTWNESLFTGCNPCQGQVPPSAWQLENSDSGGWRGTTGRSHEHERALGQGRVTFQPMLLWTCPRFVSPWKGKWHYTNKCMLLGKGTYNFKERKSEIWNRGLKFFQALYPESDEFRLGIQKSKETIEVGVQQSDIFLGGGVEAMFQVCQGEIMFWRQTIGNNVRVFVKGHETDRWDEVGRQDWQLDPIRRRGIPSQNVFGKSFLCPQSQRGQRGSGSESWRTYWRLQWRDQTVGPVE